MKGKYLISLAVLAIPASLVAQDAGKYQCTHGDLVRRVEIYTEPGVTVPCEVHYFKDTEAPGVSEVLWSAQAQEGYCEQKVTEFVAQLEGWGWDCGASDAAAPAEEPATEPEQPSAPVLEDDTDVLSPGGSEG